MPTTTPASIGDYTTSYDTETFNIVKLLPDLVTNIGSFLFVQESGAADPNASIATGIAPFENGVRDTVKALIEKNAEVKAYAATLQYSGFSLSVDGTNATHPYATTLFPVLASIASYYTSVKNDLTNILTQIDTFNTSTFGAFAIISSEPYKQIATLLPANYSLNFISTTQNFVASGKTIDVYTEQLYKNSVPSGLVTTFVNGSASRVQTLKAIALPNKTTLDAAATAWVPPSTGGGGG